MKFVEKTTSIPSLLVCGMGTKQDTMLLILSFMLQFKALDSASMLVGIIHTWKYSRHLYLLSNDRNWSINDWMRSIASCFVPILHTSSEGILVFFTVDRMKVDVIICGIDLRLNDNSMENYSKNYVCFSFATSTIRVLRGLAHAI
jgi:hypothetical protein